ncbi:hypothetical protein JGI3_01960 [Candidatus Kryptobacter tengchongensis]|nr:hypothetical protein JGI3_01960 [Candidatus Kryptobacter tengchongensis]
MNQEVKIFSSASIYKLILSLLIFSMQFETIPLPLKVQIAPLTGIFVILFFVFTLDYIYITPLFSMFLLWFAFGLLHSTVLLVIDLLLNFNGEPLRFLSWLRQIITFIIGALIFWSFRYFIKFSNEKNLCYAVAVLSLPSLILGFINALWGLFNLSVLGKIVIFLRKTFAPYGFISNLRSSGFSLEPSTFSGYLVLIVFPFALLMRKYNKYLSNFVFILALISFIWTFSLSGFILIFMTSFLGFIFFPKRRRVFFLIFIIIVFLFIGVVYLFSWSQIVRHISFIETGKTNISITDRFYSTFGPFLRTFSSFVIIGYGIGGVSFHFRDILPENIYHEIIRSGIRWKEFANVGTLIGRVYSEMGLIGFILFILMLYIGIYQGKEILKRMQDYDKEFYSISLIMLIASILSLFYLFGSYHNPYFWFWLAILDKKFHEISNNANLCHNRKLQ